MKSYLETLDCLKQRSPNTIHKLIVLETILGNMHYLINLFRPRQAKILISNVLLAQIQQCKNTILQIDSFVFCYFYFYFYFLFYYYLLFYFIYF